MFNRGRIRARGSSCGEGTAGRSPISTAEVGTPVHISTRRLFYLAGEGEDAPDVRLLLGCIRRSPPPGLLGMKGEG